MLSLVAQQSQQSELLGYTCLTFCASAITIDMSKTYLNKLAQSKIGSLQM